ncbi:MAG: alanine racemase [Bacteroidota bacterium]
MRYTRAEINLPALKFNLEGIRKRVGKDVKIMGLVKSNAYGHGLREISGALVEFGIDFLGVSIVEEGIKLRQQGIKCPIIILGGVPLHQVTNFLEYDLDMAVSSVELAHTINDLTAGSRIKPKIHINIDSGMGRLGTRPETAPLFIEQAMMMKNLRLVGVYSHFATSDERDKTYAYEQLHRFSTVVNFLKSKGIELPYIHIANSGAVLDMPESYFTMVRPGMIMFGLYPSRETSESIALKPVLSLKSNIIFIKNVSAGTAIGYHRTHLTKRETRIATIPIGYGDGYSYRLSNHSEVLIHEHRHPIVGTVTMDQIMVDVGPDATFRVGDEVVLIGSQGKESIPAQELASKLGTITYEIFTGITSRVPRIITT